MGTSLGLVVVIWIGESVFSFSFFTVGSVMRRKRGESYPPCSLIFTKLSPNPSSLSGTSFFSPPPPPDWDCLVAAASEHLAEKNANNSCCLTIASSQPSVFSIIIFKVILSLMTWASLEDGVGGDSGRGGRGGNVPVGRTRGDEAVVLVKGAAKSLEVISGLVPIKSSTAVPSPPSSSSIRRSFSSLSSHTLHPASTAILAASQSRILVNSTPKRCQPSTFFSSISRLLRIASIACGIFRAWA